MKLPYSWLREMVDGLPAPAEAAAILTMRGFEIEEWSSPGAAIQDILVAKILDLKPHPNADKLTLCDVTDGSRNYSIVCGASNMKAGDCVALAQIGTVLPGLQTRKTQIRGFTPRLLSTRELELGDDHAGIMILPRTRPGTAPGGFSGTERHGFRDQCHPQPAGRPLRPGHRPGTGRGLWPGIARAGSDRSGGRHGTGFYPRRRTRDGDLCPGTPPVIGVRVGPSPEWLVKRLKLRPPQRQQCRGRHNLVLMELGQPLRLRPG